MQKEVNCINSKVVLEYVKEHNNGDIAGLLENLDPEIDALSDPESFLTDSHNWVSCTVASRLYERARLILDDEMAAYKIAKYSVEKNSLGFRRIIAKVFWSYKTGLKHAQKLNDKWNRNKKVELVEIRRNGAVIRLHWNKTMDTSKDLCLMNQGTYTFLPLLLGGKPLYLQEKCCYFEGSPYCEYHLKWPYRNRLHEIYSRFFTSKSLMMETIAEMEKDKETIEEKYEEVNRLNLSLNYKIKQLIAIQETGKAILSVLDLEQLLTVIMNLLSNVCQIDRAVIMLVNEEEGCLEYIHGVDVKSEVHEEMRNYKVSLDRVSNILVRVTTTGLPEYVPEVASSSLRKENIMLTYGNPTSVFVVPLITRSKVIGVIATDAVDESGVPKHTRETLEVFAPQIAIAIENARLYSKLQEQMQELKRSQILIGRVEKFSFLGNLAARLAHEIKNPLTAIGTFFQMFPSRYNDKEFRNDFYKIAMEETERVNNLVTEMLDLVNTKEPHFELSDLHDLIGRMVLLVSPQTNAKEIIIDFKFDPNIGLVWMDAEKMKQVILNLLANAIDFAPKKGIIELVTKNCIEKGKPEVIRIEIKDNGPGIPPSNIDKVFDPYFTTKHKSDMHQGTGLGLFIAHQNMQDHGGTIEVKNNTAKGTTFTLSFPPNRSA